MVRNITGEEEISPIRKHTANGCFLDTEFTTAIEGAGFPDLGGGLFLGNYGSLFLKFNPIFGNWWLFTPLAATRCPEA